MPNWCFTNMTFHGNKKEIEDFHAKIEEWTSKELLKNGFGNDWLGNILIGAGLGDRIDAADSDIPIRCRGDIIYFGEVEIVSDEAATFDLEQETAWAPMCALWTEVINKLGYESIGYSYIAEEPGMEIYEICDPYGDFPDRYYIDIYLEEEDEKNEALMEIYNTRYYTEEEDIVDALQGLLNTDETDFKVLKEKAENYQFANEHSYLLVYKYDVVDEPFM